MVSPVNSNSYYDPNAIDPATGLPYDATNANPNAKIHRDGDQHADARDAALGLPDKDDHAVRR